MDQISVPYVGFAAALPIAVAYPAPTRHSNVRYTLGGSPQAFLTVKSLDPQTLGKFLRPCAPTVCHEWR